MHFIGIGLLALALWLMWGPMILSETAPLPSNSPASKLSDVERVYYRQVFDYTMDTVRAGGRYDWQTYSATGSITVSETFVSQSEARCRRFSENFVMGSLQETASGIACKRQGKDGWCRLHEKSALTCAMEPPEGIAVHLSEMGDTASKAGHWLWRFFGNLLR